MEYGADDEATEPYRPPGLLYAFPVGAGGAELMARLGGAEVGTLMVFPAKIFVLDIPFAAWILLMLVLYLVAITERLSPD